MDLDWTDSIRPGIQVWVADRHDVLREACVSTVVIQYELGLPKKIVAVRVCLQSAFDVHGIEGGPDRIGQFKDFDGIAGVREYLAPDRMAALQLLLERALLTQSIQRTRFEEDCERVEDIRAAMRRG